MVFLGSFIEYCKKNIRIIVHLLPPFQIGNRLVLKHPNKSKTKFLALVKFVGEEGGAPG
jgi:hypothetical protein